MRRKSYQLLISFCLLFWGMSISAQMPVRLNERPISLSTSSGKINGKMIIPGTTTFPLVLIIAGSGPTDMDGNSAVAGMKNNSLKYLAEELGRRGIGSLRFDKRGIASSSGAGKDEYSMRFEDGIKDVREWIDLLSRDRRLSGIYIAGHSEGALVGMLASQDNPKVKGYISLAGAGRPMSDLLEEQMAGQPEVIRKMVVSINDSLKAGKLVPSVPLGLQALFRSSVQPYLISCYKYDPQKEIKKLTVPVLLLQGKTDIQVSVKDAELLKQALPSAEMHLIDGMNHVLKNCATTDRQAQMAVYNDPDLPVDENLLLFIEKFVKKP
nr:alpha/beta hydrolase [Parabacteroides goldsteinii]